MLGVARDADETEIKKAFRKLARELHPDVNTHDPDAEEKFKEAAEAYEILSDPERRARSTTATATRACARRPEPELRRLRLDLRPLRRVLRRRAAFGGFGGAAARAGRRRRGRRRDRPRAGRGAAPRSTSRFEAVDRCERCHGNGAEPGTPIKTCERCGGNGVLQAVSRTPFGQVVRTVACDVCDGDGKVPEKPCTRCDGRGREVRRTPSSVDVPAGIADGQRIRLSGRGHAGERGRAARRPLRPRRACAPHERFLRDGDDLVTVLDVPAPLAALGATLAGRRRSRAPRTSRSRPGTQPGETIALRGKGMPVLRRPGRRGDLRVVVNVVIPRQLDASSSASCSSSSPSR